MMIAKSVKGRPALNAVLAAFLAWLLFGQVGHLCEGVEPIYSFFVPLEPARCLTSPIAWTPYGAQVALMAPEAS